MLKDTYTYFNKTQFSPEKYQRVLTEIHTAAGDTCLRMCETPVFIPRSFADATVQGATEIIQQTMALAEQGALEPAVPPSFNIPAVPNKPSFFIIDFAVAKDNAGHIVPRLIEMQAFASNLLFIPAAAEIYKEVYGLGDAYQYLLSPHPPLEETILGTHAPENVVLMEINPWQQQSRRDFVVTNKKMGIPIVDVVDVMKQGRQLFYRNPEGELIRIHRIYNRIIPTEFDSLQMGDKIQFKFTDDLDVEWAGDPSWFLRGSKYTMPFLKHPMVPETKFLNQYDTYPDDLENYVLKPVFFNAGIGVQLNVTKEMLAAIDKQDEYILMRKVDFAPFIPDPAGNLHNAEVRVMYVWPDHGKLTPVAMSARVMRGNNTNENLWGNETWGGLAPVLIVKEEA